MIWYGVYEKYVYNEKTISKEDLLEAIDIPGSEIIAIMLANFRLFKPASEDILL